MSNSPDPTTDPSQPAVYQIRLKGHLGSQWTDWFEGLTITLEDNGDTLLTGPVVDQLSLLCSQLYRGSRTCIVASDYGRQRAETSFN